MATATKSKTDKMLTLLRKESLTVPQITRRCGFAGPTSVTSVISAARRRGVKIVVKGESNSGLNKYAVL
jgi:hypothetical protein